MGVLSHVFTRVRPIGTSRALRARGMTSASAIGGLARAFAIGAALMGATAYGYFIHRNHAFPYGYCNPQANLCDPGSHRCSACGTAC